MSLNFLFRALRRSSDMDGSSSQLGLDHEAAGSAFSLFAVVEAGSSTLGSAALGSDWGGLMGFSALSDGGLEE
jgi:hypothetical protein